MRRYPPLPAMCRNVSAALPSMYPWRKRGGRGALCRRMAEWVAHGLASTSRARAKSYNPKTTCMQEASPYAGSEAGDESFEKSARRYGVSPCSLTGVKG